MSVGVVHWHRSSERTPEDSGKSYLYLCYDENTHDWWIGCWTFKGQRHQGEALKPGWANGSEPTHWAHLPTPTDSSKRPLAREERRS